MPYLKKGECRNTGRTFFKKGMIPWNKGKKGICKSNSGSFKKGEHRSTKTEFKKGQPKPKNAYKFPKDKNHPMWKGGRYMSKGYVMIFQPNHPFLGHPDGYVLEHRLVMEKILKRYLLPKERVHHLNEIKDDNRPENLKYFPNESNHQKFHFRLKKIYEVKQD